MDRRQHARAIRTMRARIEMVSSLGRVRAQNIWLKGRKFLQRNEVD
jgi:hypothetical protein